ncbi:unnamed protein product [Amoebophrya sp. A25]|nr:unnamed protein product [Amoebophrya sp. A25]|eukprot:GSA25T00010953001.1
MSSSSGAPAGTGELDFVSPDDVGFTSPAHVEEAVDLLAQTPSSAYLYPLPKVDCLNHADGNNWERNWQRHQQTARFVFYGDDGSSEEDIMDLEDALPHARSSRRSKRGGSIRGSKRGSIRGSKRGSIRGSKRGSTRGDDEWVAEDMDEDLRHHFARKTMLYTAIMLCGVAAIMTTVKMIAFRYIDAVAFTPQNRDQPLSKDMQEMYEGMNRVFVANLGYEEMGDAKWVKQMSMVFGSWQALSMMIATFSSMLLLPLYCVITCKCLGPLVRAVPFCWILPAGMAVAWGGVLQFVCYTEHGGSLYIAFSMTALTMLALWIWSVSMRFDLVYGFRVWIFLLVVIALFGGSLCLIAGGACLQGKLPFSWMMVYANVATFSVTSWYVLYIFRGIASGTRRRKTFTPDDCALASIYVFIEIIHLALSVLDCCAPDPENRDSDSDSDSGSERDID